MSRNTRTVPAALLAVIVLIVAVAGTATAAKLITGKGIKNNTVTSQDIKDNSLKSRDVKNGSLGVADLSSLARTSLRYDFDDSVGINVPACTDTALDDCSNLLVAGIKPGSQLVTFSGAIDNLNAVVPEISNRCGIVQGGQVLNEFRFALAANTQPGETQSFTMQHVVTVPDASLPVTLRCTEMGGESLRLVEPRLTVIQVASVN